MEILEFVELSHSRHKLARQLSGGMLRRLNLAATLVHDPELVFLDEPTAGVDPVLRSKFWEHFRVLQAQGRTLFITTQYVSEAAYCDLVGVIDQGRLVILNTPARIRYHAFGGDLVDLHSTEPLTYESMHALNALPFVRSEVQRKDDYSARLVVEEASTNIATLLDWAREQQLQIESVEEYVPPFDEVFVELVKSEVEHAGSIHQPLENSYSHLGLHM